MNPPKIHPDTADALASPVESFRRSRSNVYTTAENLTATPGARYTISIDHVRIDHPSVVEDLPYGFLSILVINHPVAPIIAAADYTTGTETRAPKEILAELLQQVSGWLTIDTITANRFFSTEDVYRFLHAHDHEYLVCSPWTSALADKAESLLSDKDDTQSYPDILRYSHPSSSARAHTVFLNHNEQHNQFHNPQDVYTPFDTNLPAQTSIPALRDLAEQQRITIRIRDILRSLHAIGITDAHHYLFLTAINNSAAATLQHPGHDPR